MTSQRIPGTLPRRDRAQCGEMTKFLTQLYNQESRPLHHLPMLQQHYPNHPQRLDPNCRRLG